jgi:plastocyanin domain-containing protein
MTLENMWRGFWCTVSFCNDTTALSAPGNTQAVLSDNPTIEIADTGYNPNAITIKAGSQVTLHVKNTGGRGCTQTLTIPKLGIQKSVPIGTSDTISFTAPTQTGELPFMCSMGMYRGTFNVI